MSKKPVPQTLEFEEVAPVKIPVRIGSRNFLLRPATAGEVIQYRNFIVRTTKVDAGTRVASTQGYADSEPFLLAICLTEVKEGGREVPVSVQTIKSWPNEVMNKIFETCQQISGLIDDDEDKDASEEELIARKEELEEKLNRKREQAVAGTNGKAPDAREELVKNG